MLIDFRLAANFTANYHPLPFFKMSNIFSVSEAILWRTDLTLQVMGRVQTAPVNNDANNEWGLYSVNESGMQAGHTVVLTGPLEKPIAQKKKVVGQKKQKTAQEPSGGRGKKKKVTEVITTRLDHAGSEDKNENESADDDGQSTNDDGKDKDSLPIVVVSELMNSKFWYYLICILCTAFLSHIVDINFTIEKLKKVKYTGAIKFQGDSSTYFLIQPSTSVPVLRLFSLAGTLAGKVRPASSGAISESNCEFVLIETTKCRSGNSKAAARSQHLQDRVGLVATKSIQDGEEMRLSINYFRTIA
jgi:hypothetical protein